MIIRGLWLSLAVYFQIFCGGATLIVLAVASPLPPTTPNSRRNDGRRSDTAITTAGRMGKTRKAERIVSMSWRKDGMPMPFREDHTFSCGTWLLFFLPKQEIHPTPGREWHEQDIREIQIGDDGVMQWRVHQRARYQQRRRMRDSIAADLGNFLALDYSTSIVNGSEAEVSSW
ncbi:hypothetical protein BU24DRAFT_118543 [Aaosphaeria arxii CBS 175.79]|uniref:Uncharacterized protein n=1 Tax=Aaosphaeria arxii CBS 175.79 TaxID=1450172 RepID=A0A6A5Y3I3_9PLEO|nr:uncharacterized protein BU24DRAFT_118543 [Aaosphaeria arxii CBS 175.79]KAF2019370.1 hypothetical protein BU24DRAFT_118543 [Aaosphaeria arxii CBS 175.79]